MLVLFSQIAAHYNIHDMSSTKQILRSSKRKQPRVSYREDEIPGYSQGGSGSEGEKDDEDDINDSYSQTKVLPLH